MQKELREVSMWNPPSSSSDVYAITSQLQSPNWESSFYPNLRNKKNIMKSKEQMQHRWKKDPSKQVSKLQMWEYYNSWREISFDKHMQYRISAINALEVLTRSIHSDIDKKYRSFTKPDELRRNYQFEDFSKWQKVRQQTREYQIKTIQLNREYIRQKARMGINNRLVGQLEERIRDMQFEKQEMRRRIQWNKLRNSKAQQRYEGHKDKFSESVILDSRIESEVAELKNEIQDAYGVLDSYNKLVKLRNRHQSQEADYLFLNQRNQNLKQQLLEKHKDSLEFDNCLKRVDAKYYNELRELEQQMDAFIEELHTAQRKLQVLKPKILEFELAINQSGLQKQISGPEYDIQQQRRLVNIEKIKRRKRRERISISKQLQQRQKLWIIEEREEDELVREEQLEG